MHLLVLSVNYGKKIIRKGVNRMKKKLLCLFIAFVLVMNPVLLLAGDIVVRPGIPSSTILIAKADKDAGFSVDPASAYNQGTKDGKSFISSSFWCLMGFGFGLIGVGVAYLVGGGNPSRSMVESMGPAYKEGYKKASKDSKTSGALVGWLLWIVYLSTVGLPQSN